MRQVPVPQQRSSSCMVVSPRCMDVVNRRCTQGLARGAGTRLRANFHVITLMPLAEGLLLVQPFNFAVQMNQKPLESLQQALGQVGRGVALWQALIKLSLLRPLGLVEDVEVVRPGQSVSAVLRRIRRLDRPRKADASERGFDQ